MTAVETEVSAPIVLVQWTSNLTGTARLQHYLYIIEP